MNIRCSTQKPDAPFVLALPVFGRTVEWPDELCETGRTALDAWVKKWNFPGAVGTTAWVPCPEFSKTGRYVLLIGVGEKDELTTARWWRAWATAGKAMQSGGAGNGIAFGVPVWAAEQTGDFVRLAADGLVSGSYILPSTSPRKKQTLQKLQTCVLFGKTASRFRSALAEGVLTAETLSDVKNIANLAANQLNPEILSQKVQTLAKREGLHFKMWTHAQLEKLGCGAFCAVSKGSHKAGRLIRLEWNKSAPGKPLVLVGKAITFDSGGISLKPGRGMEWMKFDKSGGMTVLAALLLAARKKIKRRVIAYIPASENMPGGEASRPGDVVTAKNGKTIEILNTDAEGRLILADALCMAMADRPAAVIDVATLTGAAVIALGHEATAAMTNHASLLDALKAAAATEGEPLWELPLWEEYGDMLKGTFADLKNIGDGSAGTISGGKFLQNFVADGVPWVHLDVAGTAYLESPKPWGGVGVTLACARMLVRWMAGR